MTLHRETCPVTKKDTWEQRQLRATCVSEGTEYSEGELREIRTRLVSPTSQVKKQRGDSDDGVNTPA